MEERQEEMLKQEMAEAAEMENMEEAAVVMDKAEIKQIAEALFFVACEPLPTARIAEICGCPEAEADAAIRELAADKTVIFISHRLSTTRMADTIFMLENGRVIERGSHEMLMEQNGKYAEMFRLQAEKYREE